MAALCESKCLNANSSNARGYHGGRSGSDSAGCKEDIVKPLTCRDRCPSRAARHRVHFGVVNGPEPCVVARRELLQSLACAFACQRLGQLLPS